MSKKIFKTIICYMFCVLGSSQKPKFCKNTCFWYKNTSLFFMLQNFGRNFWTIFWVGGSGDRAGGGGADVANQVEQPDQGQSLYLFLTVISHAEQAVAGIRIQEGR